MRVYPRILFHAAAHDGPPGASIEELSNFYQNSKKDDVLNLPLFYAILESVYDTETQSLKVRFVEEILPSCLILSTGLDYTRNKVWHGFNNPGKIEFNVDISQLKGRYNLKEIIKEKEFEKFLRAIFMAKDLEKVFEVLNFYGKEVVETFGKNEDFVFNEYIRTFGETDKIAWPGCPTLSFPNSNKPLENVVEVGSGLDFHVEFVELDLKHTSGLFTTWYRYAGRPPIDLS